MNPETRIPKYSTYSCSALEHKNVQWSHQDDMQVVLDDLASP